MPQPKIPNLRTRREVAEFWDTHDITDYLHELESIEAVYEPIEEATEAFSIRLPVTLKRNIQSIAKQAHISASDLVRLWMFEKTKTYRKTT